MGSYGRTVLSDTGRPIQVAIDENIEWKYGGITIDWATVAAPGSDVVVPEGFTVPSGRKYLRYGQVLTRITAGNVQTLTISGTPTGGTFTLSGNLKDTGAYVITAPIAYNATAAAVLAALQASNVFGSTPITVSGSAGGPYTITTPLALLVGDGSALTGGTAPAATVVLTTPGTSYGKFGPFDPTATDGRQTLTNGEVVILNHTTIKDGLTGLSQKYASDHPGGIIGGPVWKDRVIATNGAQSLAAGPTWANLLAAMPRLQPVGQS